MHYRNEKTRNAQAVETPQDMHGVGVMTEGRKKEAGIARKERTKKETNVRTSKRILGSQPGLDTGVLKRKGAGRSLRPSIADHP